MDSQKELKISQRDHPFTTSIFYWKKWQEVQISKTGSNEMLKTNCEIFKHQNFRENIFKKSKGSTNNPYSKVWALPETLYLVCSLFWYLFPSSYSKHVNPKRESRTRFLKEIQLPTNLSERWSHRTINPKLMITNKLLDTTLQATVDSSWNKN